MSENAQKNERRTESVVQRTVSSIVWRLFKPSRLDLDKHRSCSQCYTTVRIAYWFFSLPAFALDLTYCSFLLLPCHFWLSSPPPPRHQPHPPPTVQILFLPLLSSSPPFFSLPLFILSLPVSRDSICTECVVCVRICEHIETEIHLRAHWFKNTFDIGGPLLQIRSEAYHTRT